MNQDIQFAQQVSIREAGLNEIWLQDQIYDNPSALGLGDLEVLQRERSQSSGGRLDILLKNPEDDSMYEVEIMLGETDETHIIRTIEYWDNEKRRWPQRQHYAVLVAEHINRRFFNVIHLLSYSIPIIAIQASLLNLGEKRTLFFSKILDTYEEPEDAAPISDNTYDKDYWIKRAPWTLETAETLLNVIGGTLPAPSLNYLKHYVALESSGYNYFWLYKRALPKSLLGFRISPLLQDEAVAILDTANISYAKNPKHFYLAVDKQGVEDIRDALRSIAELMKRARQKD